jgi:hypothetical protein
MGAPTRLDLIPFDEIITVPLLRQRLDCRSIRVDSLVGYGRSFFSHKV